MSGVNKYDHLTEEQREERVFDLAAEGNGIKGIAALLGLSVDTMVLDGRFAEAFKGGAALFNAQMEAKQRPLTTADRPTTQTAETGRGEPKPAPAGGRKRAAKSRAVELRKSLGAWKQTPARLRPSLRALAREHGTSHQLLSYYLSTLSDL